MAADAEQLLADSPAQPRRPLRVAVAERAQWALPINPPIWRTSWSAAARSAARNASPASRAAAASLAKCASTSTCAAAASRAACSSHSRRWRAACAAASRWRPVRRPAVQPVAGPARSLPCSDRLRDPLAVRAPPAAAGAARATGCGGVQRSAYTKGRGFAWRAVRVTRRAPGSRFRAERLRDPRRPAHRCFSVEDLVDAAVLVAGVLEKLPQLRGVLNQLRRRLPQPAGRTLHHQMRDLLRVIDRGECLRQGGRRRLHSTATENSAGRRLA